MEKCKFIEVKLKHFHQVFSDIMNSPQKFPLVCFHFQKEISSLFSQNVQFEPHRWYFKTSKIETAWQYYSISENSRVKIKTKVLFLHKREGSWTFHICINFVNVYYITKQEIDSFYIQKSQKINSCKSKNSWQ